jgi:hypothetical protein
VVEMEGEEVLRVKIERNDRHPLKIEGDFLDTEKD